VNPQDVLVLAAELGIGLAGFSSLSAALKSRGSKNHTRYQRARVNTLVFSSLGVALFAYVPMVLALALDDPGIPWQITSAIYGLWQLGGLIEHLRSVPAFRDQPDFSPGQVSIAAVAFALSIALNLYNVTIAATAWPLLASLACGLVVAGSRFMQLVASLWVDDAEPSAE